MATYLIDASELREIVSAQQLRVAVAVTSSASAVLLVVVLLLLWLRSTVASSNVDYHLHRSRPSGLLQLASLLPTFDRATAMLNLPRDELTENRIYDYSIFATTNVNDVANWFADADSRRRAVYLAELARRVQTNRVSLPRRAVHVPSDDDDDDG